MVTILKCSITIDIKTVDSGHFVDVFMCLVWSSKVYGPSLNANLEKEAPRTKNYKGKKYICKEMLVKYTRVSMMTNTRELSKARL